MKTNKWLSFGLVLALSGAMLLAGSALAQNKGGGPGGQGNQLCTGGPGGVCAVNPAPTPGNQNCPAYGAGKGQKGKGMRGPKGGAQSGQSTPQANPPATNQ